MYEWIITGHPGSGWALHADPPGTLRPVQPLYRGAFESGEKAPESIRLTFRRSGNEGASARFRAPSIPGRRLPFGISVHIDPEYWHPSGLHRGWHCFRSGDIAMALHSSLPATWLAQDAGGNPLPPPWRELWSFGTDHIWSVRLARQVPREAGNTIMNPGTDSFIRGLPASPGRPGRHGGILIPGDSICIGGQE